MNGLPMTEYLLAVEMFGTRAFEIMVSEGVHPNVAYAKAEKAARKGYTDYGTSPRGSWLTDKGRAFLADGR